MQLLARTEASKLTCFGEWRMSDPPAIFATGFGKEQPAAEILRQYMLKSKRRAGGLDLSAIDAIIYQRERLGVASVYLDDTAEEAIRKTFAHWQECSEWG
jgi:hypothetical protein